MNYCGIPSNSFPILSNLPDVDKSARANGFTLVWNSITKKHEYQASGLGGDLLSTNNLSDLADIPTALINLGLNNLVNIDNTNASNISAGTLNDLRLSANVTLAGNTFNGASQLLQLDSGGKVFSSNLPDSILGNVKFKSVWNANTNSPTMPSASSTNTGWYYIVSVAGSTLIDGISDWKIGDWIISDGTTWSKVDNTDAISSWNGRAGAVLPNSGDYSFTLISGTLNLATQVTGTLPATNLPAFSGGDVTSSVGSAVLSIGSLKVTNAMIANSTINLTAKVTGLLPIANGGTNTNSSALSPSAGIIRDANSNALVNNLLEGYATQATAAGTSTALTVSSPYFQYFTGTLAQAQPLPVCSTLVLGQSWCFVNNSTQSITIQTSAGTTLIVLTSGQSAVVTCILASGTTPSSWDYNIVQKAYGTSAPTVYNLGSTLTGATAFNFNNGSVQYGTLTGAITVTLSNAVAGVVYRVILFSGSNGLTLTVPTGHIALQSTYTIVQNRYVIFEIQLVNSLYYWVFSDQFVAV